MDPLDLAKLTTFHPLNEPLTFPVDDDSFIARELRELSEQ